MNGHQTWLNFFKVAYFRSLTCFKRFSAKFVKFLAKFGSLKMQIRYNFKNITFIAFKGKKVCKYYVNSMVISCST